MSCLKLILFILCLYLNQGEIVHSDMRFYLPGIFVNIVVEISEKLGVLDYFTNSIIMCYIGFI